MGLKISKLKCPGLKVRVEKAMVEMSCNPWKDSFDLTQFLIIMKNFIINEEMVGKIGKLYAKGGFFHSIKL